MTKLFFIRHGKTEWNLAGRYQGARGDSPLLPQSYREIEDLAKYLNDFKFAKIYCSPIRRAKVTAQQIVANLNQPLKLEADVAFQEFNLGKMEGMKFTDVAKKISRSIRRF